MRQPCAGMNVAPWQAHRAAQERPHRDVSITKDPAITTDNHRRGNMWKTITLLSTAALLVSAIGVDAQTRRERFRPRGQTDSEQAAATDSLGRPLPTPRVTEAPTGFDNLTNGFLPQGPDFESLDEDSVVALRSFNDNRFVFE